MYFGNSYGVENTNENEEPQSEGGANDRDQ